MRTSIVSGRAVRTMGHAEANPSRFLRRVAPPGVKDERSTDAELG